MTLADIPSQSFYCFHHCILMSKAHEASVFTVVLLMHYNYRCNQKEEIDFFA